MLTEFLHIKRKVRNDSEMSESRTVYTREI